eukprot:jgi/Mesen1/8942/ME000552S08447
MWRLKQSVPKEQGVLEGKLIDVKNLKLQVKTTIAQGGFSTVYLAKCTQSGRNYAIKHIICSDQEMSVLVQKEVDHMSTLKGHPNTVTLHAVSSIKTGRTLEFFLIMDYCEKMLVNVMESRGGAFFEEQQLLAIFRDVCNAVYALHSQTPPIAHRDLKAENVLLAADGKWKLCDFGSTSTNHKRHESIEEMGVEEDNIRRHTTPAYRAPEMWDLYMREVLSEKVDIWALGCLLYRMAYFKSCFDGDSKLQILNGNYRIPEAPKYNAAVPALIRDMLTPAPASRPDIMQVWRRVNELLPANKRKSLPDKAPFATIVKDASQGPQTGAPGNPASRKPSSPTPESKSSASSPLPAANSNGGGLFWAQFDSQPTKMEKAPQAKSPDRVMNNPTSLRSPQDAEKPEANGWATHPEQGDKLSKKEPALSAQSARQRLGAPPLELPHSTATAGRHASEPLGVPNRAFLEAQSTTSSSAGMRPAMVASLASQLDPQGREAPGGADSAASANSALHAELAAVRLELGQTLQSKAEVVAQCEKLTTIVRSQLLEIKELKTALAVANTPANAASWSRPNGALSTSTSLSRVTVDVKPQSSSGPLLRPEAADTADMPVSSPVSTRLGREASDQYMEAQPAPKPFLWLNPDQIGNPIVVTNKMTSSQSPPASPPLSPPPALTPPPRMSQHTPVSVRTKSAGADQATGKVYSHSLVPVSASASQTVDSHEPSVSRSQSSSYSAGGQHTSQPAVSGRKEGNGIPSNRGSYQGFSGGSGNLSSFSPGIWDKSVPSGNQQSTGAASQPSTPAGWAAF